jgi:uncharacterized protein
MEIHYIPVNGHDDKYIIYRPLLKMAFLGNRALCQVIQEAAASGDLESASIPVEISQFLHSIGFDQPDPSPPTRDSTSSRPTSAVILLTNQCNLRCIYCYASAGERTPATVSLDLARPVIDQVVENAAKSGKKHFDLVFHGGGEPMVAWKEMQEIVDYARSNRLPCKVGMVSNGVWNQTQREWVVANLDRCTVSIDGGPQTQDLQRPLARGKG